MVVFGSWERMLGDKKNDCLTWEIISHQIFPAKETGPICKKH
jgi:hypothetical protein